MPPCLAADSCYDPRCLMYDNRVSCPHCQHSVGFRFARLNSPLLMVDASHLYGWIREGVPHHISQIKPVLLLTQQILFSSSSSYFLPPFLCVTEACDPQYLRPRQPDLTLRNFKLVAADFSLRPCPVR